MDTGTVAPTKFRAITTGDGVEPRAFDFWATRRAGTRVDYQAQCPGCNQTVAVVTNTINKNLQYIATHFRGSPEEEVICAYGGQFFKPCC